MAIGAVIGATIAVVRSGPREATGRWVIVGALAGAGAGLAVALILER